MLKQGFFVGNIRHRRYRPKPHQFNYRMYWSLLDLDQLAETFSKSRLWSLERWNLISFRQKDFHQNKSLGTHDQSANHTKQAIAETIRQKTGEAFTGKVFLLSHLRFLGFNFNSVCFYFCYDNQQLKYIVSEIPQLSYQVDEWLQYYHYKRPPLAYPCVTF